jgi:hypothetical protein
LFSEGKRILEVLPKILDRFSKDIPQIMVELFKCGFISEEEISDNTAAVSAMI